eukprot:scaffold1055_cov165-Amphora_coffeaeformis.AAC.24
MDLTSTLLFPGSCSLVRHGGIVLCYIRTHRRQHHALRILSFRGEFAVGLALLEIHEPGL